jgi:hypothetical protein
MFNENIFTSDCLVEAYLNIKSYKVSNFAKCLNKKCHFLDDPNK